METLKTPPKTLISPIFLMNSTSANLRTTLRFFNYTKVPTLFTSSAYLPITHDLIHGKNCTKRGLDNRVRVGVKVSNAAELKENWLDSLSCPPPHKIEECPTKNGVGLDWVIGIDPDLSGALALLKPDGSGCSAQVFDNPFVQVLVGKRVRKRLDAKSIVQMLRSFDAPLGTTAYIEQSIPFPQDGKQGWWSGGFGYGMWIGVLVASGFSVVPVPSSLWKNHFELSGSLYSKDDSRKAASTLFPSLSSLLTRKKDHGLRLRAATSGATSPPSSGVFSTRLRRLFLPPPSAGYSLLRRFQLFSSSSSAASSSSAGRAEALLIAAYGKGLKIKADSAVEIKSDLCTKSDSAFEIKSDLCTTLT